MKQRSVLICAILAACAAAAAAESISPEDLELVKRAEQERIRAIESVYGSVVAVYGANRQGGGSGVLIDPAGFALTNHHVVAGAGAAGQGGLADGKLYPWKLIGTDPGGDVAIIQLQREGDFPASPLGRSDDVRVGDWAMAMGNPFLLAEDQRPTVTLGIVSGVKRYQYGAGSNTLVYGNCIQVDSSINPGNSGGPLFNLHGQVIGINGRGSFKERGRVNVGVGYAISMRQIRNFVPELMATKLAQHGTLDALFTNRRDIDGNEAVICSTINLDSPVAKLGLALGDKLVAFEGQPIDDANQFTNLISTLPADWPVELTYDREGVQKTLWVRLTALPYGQQQIHPPEEQPPKGEEPPKADEGGGEQEKAQEKDEGEDNEKPDEPKPDDEKPDQPKAPQPRRIQVGRARPNFGQEGRIRDLELNRKNAAYVARRWRQFSGVADMKEGASGFEIVDDLMRKDKRIGQARTLLTRDGRFRVSYTEYGAEYVYVFDGEKYYAHLPDQPPGEIDVDTLLAQPLAAQAAALAAMFREAPLENLGSLRIDGSDKAQRRPCFRLRISATDDDRSTRWFVWLRQFDDAGQPHIELSKTAADVDGAETGVAYADWKKVGGVALPHTRSLVSGLDEAFIVQLRTVEAKPLEKLDDDEFRSLADAE